MKATAPDGSAEYDEERTLAAHDALFASLRSLPEDGEKERG